jgi:hypothetical protein
VVGGASVGATACSSSDGDPYLAEVQAELSTAAFTCGESRCALHHEYCVVKWNVAGAAQGIPAEYSCEIVPPQCADRSVCRCLGATQCYEERGKVVVSEP